MPLAHCRQQSLSGHSPHARSQQTLHCSSERAAWRLLGVCKSPQPVSRVQVGTARCPPSAAYGPRSPSSESARAHERYMTEAETCPVSLPPSASRRATEA
eukprot:scaffold2933_cov31-Tisochrysis_lutea.AAC.7